MRKKFVQTLDTEVYNVLSIVAEAKSIPIHELLRTVVVPDWMRLVGANSRRKSLTRRS